MTGVSAKNARTVSSTPTLVPAKATAGNEKRSASAAAGRSLRTCISTTLQKFPHSSGRTAVDNLLVNQRAADYVAQTRGVACGYSVPTFLHARVICNELLRCASFFHAIYYIRRFVICFANAMPQSRIF